MKFAILTIAYQEERFLPLFVKHYEGLVHTILILNSTNPYYEGVEDGYTEIFTSEGIITVNRYWEREENQRNYGLKMLEMYDWVFILDPDEYITVADFNRIKQFLESNPDRVAWKVPMQKTYWKKGYAIYPPEPYRQLIAVKPDRVKFMDKRGIDQEVWRLPIDFTLHHFSMARTDEEVLRKMTCFSHSKDFDGKKWYEDKWLKWTPESRDFHPTCPDSWHSAISTSVPDEFKHILESI